MRRILVVTLSLPILLALPAQSKVSERNPLIWEDQFDLAGRTDVASGITVSSRMAVAIGVGSTANGGIDLLVRAYDVKTGTLKWHDQTPLASGYIVKTVIDDVGHKVFGAGYAANGPGTDFLVRAYDARTGNRLWQDVVNKGRDDLVQGIAAGPEGVFVVGYGGNIGGSALKFLVRAYDKTIGALLWEDQVGNGMNDAVAWQVETEGDLVFVSGSIGQGPDQELMLRAYDARTGRLVWDTRYPTASPYALAVDADRVYVGGNAVGIAGGAYSAFLAAYDINTGNLLWQERLEAASGSILDLAVNGSQVFASGQGTSLLRSYDVWTGTLIWESQTGSPNGQYENASGVDVGSDLVFVAGRRGDPFEDSEFLVQAYDRSSGELAWEDSSHRSNRLDTGASGIAVKGQHVFAVGRAGTAATQTDFLIRAYSVNKLKPRPRGIN